MTYVSTDIAYRWVDFIQMYWHLIDEDKRESYVIDMAEGIEPPKIEDLTEVDEYDVKRIRKHIGNAVKKYRVLSGMKQVELSSLLGMTPSYVSFIESGSKMCNTIDLLRIFKILKIPMTELTNIPFTSYE